MLMKKILLFTFLSVSPFSPAFSNIYLTWATEPSGVTFTTEYADSETKTMTVKSGQTFLLQGLSEYYTYKWFGEGLPESGLPFGGSVTVSNPGPTDIVRVYRVYRIPATGDPVSTEYVITATITPEQGVAEPEITNNTYCNAATTLTASNCPGTVKWYKVVSPPFGIDKSKSVVPGANTATFAPTENGTYCATCTVGGSESFGGNTITFSTTSGVQPYISILKPESNITACMWSEHTFEATGVGLEAGTVTWQEKIGSDPYTAVGTGNTQTITLRDANTSYQAVLSIEGCTNKTSSARTFTVQAPTALTENAERTITIRNGSNTAGTPDCRLISVFGPNTPELIGKSLKIKVSKDAIVQLYDNQPYLQKHYDFEPLDALTEHPYYNVNMYFTQADFDAFNAKSSVKLPVNAEDTEGYLGNLRIWQVHGAPASLPATPGNYTGGPPSGYGWQAAIGASWNSDLQAWVVSFNTNGFSGFFITAEGATPLPVSLADFTAQKQENSVQLRWKTTEEADSDHFEVLHSPDGNEWGVIGSVAAAGESSLTRHYTFVHADPAEGLNYYRLKMTDRDGRYTYSKVVSRAMPYSQNPAVSPNPAQAFIRVRSQGIIQSYNLVTMTGRIVSSGSGMNTGDFEIPTGAFGPGIYLLRLSDDRGGEYIRKIALK